MYQNRFFIPYVGANYQFGIYGKRILIVGASFYCNRADCKFFDDCTSHKRMDSSTFDSICPVYEPKGKYLHNEPSYCVEDAPKTYQIFANSMAEFVDGDCYEDIWSHFAFTNYVQSFLPAKANKFRSTSSNDLTARDYYAFMKTLVELQPNIVVIWGCVINKPIIWKNSMVLDKSELEHTEEYICHIQVPGVSHPIAIINPNHPSSSAWFTNLATFKKYFKSLVK